MSKTVLVRLDGQGVYETLEEASKVFDMASGNISRAVSESGKVKGVKVRWAERVWAVREKRSGRWVVAILNARNTWYVPLCQSEPRIKAGDVDMVKDLTRVWYADK